MRALRGPRGDRKGGSTQQQLPLRRISVQPELSRRYLGVCLGGTTKCRAAAQIERSLCSGLPCNIVMAPRALATPRRSSAQLGRDARLMTVRVVRFVVWSSRCAEDER